jgi:CheY-like chemotaxis protein
MDAIVAHDPELLFLDIRMPGLDGLEVATALESVSPEASPPAVIFVTAFDGIRGSSVRRQCRGLSEEAL